MKSLGKFTVYALIAAAIIGVLALGFCGPKWKKDADGKYISTEKK